MTPQSLKSLMALVGIRRKPSKNQNQRETKSPKIAEYTLAHLQVINSILNGKSKFHPAK